MIQQEKGSSGKHREVLVPPAQLLELFAGCRKRALSLDDELLGYT